VAALHEHRQAPTRYAVGSSSAQQGTAQHCTAQHGTAQHSQHSTARHGTAQHGTAQHSTITDCLLSHEQHSVMTNIKRKCGKQCTDLADVSGQPDDTHCFKAVLAYVVKSNPAE